MKFNKYGIAKIYTTKSMYEFNTDHIGGLVGAAMGLMVGAKLFDVISDAHIGSINAIQ